MGQLRGTTPSRVNDFFKYAATWSGGGVSHCQHLYWYPLTLSFTLAELCLKLSLNVHNFVNVWNLQRSHQIWDRKWGPMYSNVSIFVRGERDGSARTAFVQWNYVNKGFRNGISGKPANWPVQSTGPERTQEGMFLRRIDEGGYLKRGQILRSLIYIVIFPIAHAFERPFWWPACALTQCIARASSGSITLNETPDWWFAAPLTDLSAREG